LRLFNFHRKGIKTIIVLFLLPQIYFAVQQDSSEVTSNKIPLINLSGLAVAELGNKKIYADEFLNSYEFGPAFVKRENNSKKRFLEFMIYEKMLALEGYKKNLDKSPDVQLYLNDIVDDLASEQMYRETIWDKVIIDSETVSKAVEKELIELEISWIYKPTKSEIEEQYYSLKKRIPFDSLFYGQFNDSVTYDSRHMKSTRFKLEKTNPTLAVIIDSVKIGSPSLPIKTVDGWYIVRVDNLWKNLISTETQNNELRYSLEEYLRKQKADSLSDAFVNKLILDNQSTIVRTTFNKLAVYVGKKILPPAKFDEWNLVINIQDKNFNLSKIENSYQDLLVRTNSVGFTIKDFIGWYTNREPYIRFNLISPQAFYNSLQSVVWRMVRDKLLGNIAKEKGYNKKPEIEKQKLWWKDKLVYSKMKLEIAGSVKLSDEQVKKYYNENLKKYVDENGRAKQFDDIKKDVWNDYYVYAYTKKVVNKILSLKEKYHIKINDEALNSLIVLDENNPRTIEIYSLKKSGTIVRPVYPSIDYEWQFWN